jgi:hypothetical protein
MNRILPWILALATLLAVANFSGARTSVQEPPRPKQDPKPRPEKQPGMAQAKKNRAARQAALKAALPTLKTRLSEAILLAEKETGGTAYSAGLEITEGKPSFQVNLFADERFAAVSVDPETKKATRITKPAGEEVEPGADEEASGEAKDE